MSGRFEILVEQLKSYDSWLAKPTGAFSPSVILGGTAMGLVFSIMYSWASNRKLGRQWLIERRITLKSGELDQWGYFFNGIVTSYVTIRDHERDLIYDGWCVGFSDDAQKAEVILKDVSVYRNSTAERIYQVPHLYISRDRNQISVEVRTGEVAELVKWKEE